MSAVRARSLYLSASISAGVNTSTRSVDVFPIMPPMGLHVAVNCLVISGNQAVIGGVVTPASTGFAAGSVGRFALTSVVDNGTSKNDPADQLSFSSFGFPNDGSFDCTTLTRFTLFNLTNGQVKVW